MLYVNPLGHRVPATLKICQKMHNAARMNGGAVSTVRVKALLSLATYYGGSMVVACIPGSLRSTTTPGLLHNC